MCRSLNQLKRIALLLSAIATASVLFLVTAHADSGFPRANDAGVAEAKKVANLAQTYYIPVAPHCVVSPIGLMATAHASTTYPNFLACEWHWINHKDLWKSWVKEGEIIVNGFVTPPDKPGLGVEMDEDVAKKAQIPGTPWFEPEK